VNTPTLVVGVLGAIIAGGIVAKLASKGFRAAAITIIVVTCAAGAIANIVK